MIGCCQRESAFHPGLNIYFWMFDCLIFLSCLSSARYKDNKVHFEVKNKLKIAPYLFKPTCISFLALSFSKYEVVCVGTLGLCCI